MEKLNIYRILRNKSFIILSISLLSLWILIGCGGQSTAASNKAFAQEMLAEIAVFENYLAKYLEESSAILDYPRSASKAELIAVRTKNEVFDESATEKLNEIKSEAESVKAPNAEMQQKKDRYLQCLDQFITSHEKASEAMTCRLDVLINSDSAKIDQANTLMQESIWDTKTSLGGIKDLKQDLQSI